MKPLLGMTLAGLVGLLVPGCVRGPSSPLVSSPLSNTERTGYGALWEGKGLAHDVMRAVLCQTQEGNTQ